VVVFFVAGVGLVHVVLLAFARLFVAYRNSWEFNDSFNWTFISLSLLIAPLAGAWLASETVGRLKRPRWFDARAPRRGAAVMAGLFAGFVASVATAVALAFLTGNVPDYATAGGSAFAASAVVLVCLPRSRRGKCIACGYDLSATKTKRCPECGGWHTGQ
jgi:hypothetical protein